MANIFQYYKTLNKHGYEYSCFLHSIFSQDKTTSNVGWNGDNITSAVSSLLRHDTEKS